MKSIQGNQKVRIMDVQTADSNHLNQEMDRIVYYDNVELF